ncbi:MAG: hypothetical protein K8J09_19580 [Planctomycetes bacterium]|nr:hypothetical protein [Planctomycetota bacterium]
MSIPVIDYLLQHAPRHARRELQAFVDSGTVPARPRRLLHLLRSVVVAYLHARGALTDDSVAGLRAWAKQRKTIVAGDTLDQLLQEALHHAAVVPQR